MDKLNWVTSDCFNAVRQLMHLGSTPSGDVDGLQLRMRGFIDGMMQRGSQAQYSAEDTRLMAYAIVALADEIVMCTPGSLRDGWARRPLQMQYFNENTAGEGFFGHLETIRADSTKTDVLRVFYLCLLLGFQGRYRLGGSQVALTDLTESVRQQLAQKLAVPDQLSPFGLPPDEPLLKVTRAIPVVWLSVGAVVLSVVLYLGLQASLYAKASDMLAWIERVSNV